MISWDNVVRELRMAKMKKDDFTKYQVTFYKVCNKYV